MKPILYLICAAFLISCNSNNNTTLEQNQGGMTEDQYQASRPSNTIDIPTTFKPTIELTDEIRNTSLEDLVRQGKGKLKPIDEEMVKKILIEKYQGRGLSAEFINYMRQFAINDVVQKYRAMPCKVNLERVSVSSNLAKVLYLEDLVTFILYNQDYYFDITQKMRDEAQEAQEAENQKNWDKYR